jgi:multiple sugar transport system permease protein
MAAVVELTLTRRLERRLRSRSTFAFLLCVPIIVLILGLIAYPFAYSLHLSMLNKAQTKFVGLDNFTFLWGRETFQMVFWQSVGFTLLAVFFKSVVGLSTALMIHRLPERGQRIWRGLLLIAWVTPPALSTLGWWWLFEPTYSLVNWTLETLFGVHKPFLADPFWGRFSVVLVGIWYGAPFFMIMYLAGLKSIPLELYDAASIDGANAWQRFRYVTLPMMRNIITITMLYSTIVTFATFDIVQVLTKGGPRNSTHLFATYSFNLGIMSGDLPLAAAVSLFMVPVLAIGAFFILRNIRARVALM